MPHTPSGHGSTICSYLFEPRGEIGPGWLARSLRRDGGACALVVGQDAIARLSVMRALDELGYRYFEAGNSRAAVALLQSPVEFDLLICDVDLPQLSGRRLAQIARARRPDLRIVLVSGDTTTSPEPLSAHAETGAHDVFEPLSLSSFARVLARVLRRPQQPGVEDYLALPKVDKARRQLKR